jgi:sulfide:quinone oxidoreductase
MLVIGGNFAGLTAAYEMKRRMKGAVHVTVVSKIREFVYIPSLIWVPFGRRKGSDISFDIQDPLARKGIDFIHDEVVRVLPESNNVETKGGKVLRYDTLVIAAGAQFNWESLPGLGPKAHTRSIFSPPHAEATYEAWKEFVKDPGDVVVGATPGASCMGAGYEYLMNLDHYLRKAKIRKRVKVTWVTPEPYIGHFGIGGMKGGEALMKKFFKMLDIDFRADAAIEEVTEDSVVLKGGEVIKAKWKMLVPPFKGQEFVFASPGLGDEKGFIPTSDGYRHLRFPNIFAAGLAVKVPNPFVGEGSVPFGVPKTGYPSDEMGKIVAENIEKVMKNDPDLRFLPFGQIPGLCIMDGGNKEMIILSDKLFAEGRKFGMIIPDITGDLGKVLLEKYFLWKSRHGMSYLV